MPTRIVRGTCHHDCPDSCAWQVTVTDGRAVRLRGDPDHPFTRGELCPKVNRLLHRVYAPDRLLHPLRRIGPKGAGTFEQISWDDALSIVTSRFEAVLASDGPEAILPWSDAGNQSLLAYGSLDRRLFHALGASRLVRAICGSTARAGYTTTIGDGRGIDPEDLRHSRLIVLWGTNTAVTNRHLWPVIAEAREAGALVVVIDPVRTATAERADWFLQPLPGTDVALVLGLVHLLVRDGLVDADDVERHTDGYADLAERAAAYPPERVAALCGIDAGDVERLAHEYGTRRPAAIRVLIGPEHREHGAMFFRAVACLPSLVGAWRDRGGGMARSTAPYFDAALDIEALERPDLLAGRTPRSINMGRLGEALTDPALSPPVRALVVYNGNPAVTVPNQRLVLQGLARDDLFTVVHEQFLTDTARYADLVLPATTQLEALDVVPAWGHLYLGWNERAIEPLGECVSNTELFRRLAGALGLEEPSLYDDDETLLGQALASGSPLLDGITVDSLRAKGWQRLALPADHRPFAAGGFATASGRAALRNDGLVALGHDPLPHYQPATEGTNGDPERCARFPLVLCTTKSHQRFLNSTYSHHHGEREGEPLLEIDAVDAAARGLADGDRARVHNDRGAVLVRCLLSPRVRPGVVTLPFGWWRHQHEHGCTANVLTNDALADWGGGIAFHDTLVQVERCDDP